MKKRGQNRYSGATDNGKALQSARSTRELTEFAERHGSLLRRRAGLSPTERLDPYALAEVFQLAILVPQQIAGVSPEDLDLVGGLDPKAWSGMGRKLPDGQTLILINPRQTPERANATIMEEVAHVHLRHQPSQLVTLPTGFWKRTYDAADEQEAYWTGAAALLPSQALGRAVWKGCATEEIAAAFGVSHELVEFRIKILGLWADRRVTETDGLEKEVS